MTYEEKLDALFRGFMAALLWVEYYQFDDDRGPDEWGNTLEDKGFTVDDLARESRIAVRHDMDRFLQLLDQHPECVPDDPDWFSIGSDLYYTRQRHGTGFWDRPSIYGKACSKALTDLVDREFSEVYVWVTRNNQVYVELYIPRSATCA